jgi:XTP/dITP diphosphohydrolase
MGASTAGNDVKAPCTILIATSNPGKVMAFRRLLQSLPVHLVTPAELGLKLDVEETGTTFVDNALIKARAYRDGSGCHALADDSGLCVDALEGHPGLHSARFGGYNHSPTAQNLLLLERLQGIPPSQRGAAFISVIAFAGLDGTEWSEHGEVRGVIGEDIRGAHGFGYDPLFIFPALGRTFAELLGDEKDPISHRGQAMQQAASHLEKTLGLLQ